MRIQWIVLLPLVLARGEQLPLQNVLDDPSFNHFYNLEYDEALAGFEAAAAKDPGSADVQNHIAQTVLYRAMFHAGMLESDMLKTSDSVLKTPKLEMSPADQQQFTGAVDRAMQLAQARLKTDRDDAGALYALGVSYGLRGQYSFVRKAYLDALHDMTWAHRLHNRATQVDPGMIDAQLTQGVYDYALGSLRFGWRMIGLLGGFQGNKARGIATVNRVADEGATNRISAAILLAAIYRREHRPMDAIGILKPLIPQLPRNYLLRLELAGMYGDLGNRDAALDVLGEVERLQQAHAPGYQMLTADLVRKVRDSILMNTARNATPVPGHGVASGG
jgi:tetratricopeptide (TPR) repeat protein